MAALMYVLLAVGYGLSVWSLARQRRYTPLERLRTTRPPASASRAQRTPAPVTRRSQAAAGY
ncbi:MAG TPA: hypothetical protein VMW56_00030 [Candidatus Margulisiibacteriota bacterium]|nr:hypothetical protein [Candidatus Margulisiibacteriota bacterium]